MGHRRHSAPNRGSLGIRPRAKASKISGKWRSFGGNWVDDLDTPTLCGFPGYKVGMTHLIKLEEKKRNKRFKQEVSVAVTILEIPRTILFGVRVYKAESSTSIQPLTEVWVRDDISEDASKKIRLPADKYTEEKMNERIALINDSKDQIIEVRALVLTLAKEAGLPKKIPDLIEIKVGGKDMSKNIDWALENLGKELNIVDHFKPDEYVDVSAVTKGKGFSGPVKRHGIKILPRKTRKGRRVVGSVGSWHPARISWTTPRAGGMGFHNRTEYNKKILKIGENPREINPNAGWNNYGVVKGNYVLIEGSIPGPSKRMVRLRKTVRKTPKQFPDANPVKIQYISLNFGKEEKVEENT